MVAEHVLTPTAQAFDLPVIGDDLANIGRIIDLWVEPCHPDAIIWAYGYFQAIPTLFLTLAKPEIIDIKIAHRRGKPRKGKRYRFTAKDIFRDALIEVPVPRWVPFRIYEWSQRIGWYFLIADALENFAINWMSLAYKYAGCQGATPPYATFQNNRVLQAADNGDWPMIWMVTGANDINLVPPQVTIIEPGLYDVAWQVETEPYPLPEQSQTPYNFAIYVTDSLGSRAIAPGESGTTGGGNTANSGFARIFATEGGERIQLKSLSTGPGYYYCTGTLDFTWHDFAALEPDP